MTVSIDLDEVLNNLVSKLGTDVFFVLITSENGVVIKSYINEDEFNKASISLNVSQLYELAEEVVGEIGLHAPDFTIIHSDNYYIVSIKIIGKIVILLTLDQVEISYIFKIINETVG